MKKAFFTFCMALTAALALNAESFTGLIEVTKGTYTRTAEVTVSVIDQGNGLYELDLEVPFFNIGTLKMYDVPAATTGEITVYSAEHYVNTDSYGPLRTVVLARTFDGMMAANVSLPDQSVTIWFNTVGDHFQLPNSNFEDWNSSYTNEPNRWHGFKSAGGMFANTSANIASLGSSDDVRPGATGHSAVLTAGSFIGIVANGTMTNGKLMAGSYDANSPLNHAEMDKDNGTNDFYMPLYAKPDKFNVWLKYTQGTADANNKASVSVKTFDGTYYQEPVDKTYTNLSGSIVGGTIPAGDWTQYSFPFDYASYSANHAASNAIFVTFSTNGNPGSGSKNDAVYVDDIELVYLASMNYLRYRGNVIEGWDPAVTTYNMEIAGEPNLDDFTTDFDGASAVSTKTMERNADGSYRIAISVVSGDLQTATCYVINVTSPAGLRGDVDSNGEVNISDAIMLINYILNGSIVEINEQNSNMNDDDEINISDAITLINEILNN